MSQARSSALKAHPGKITDEELERERGGSGLRYSLDIKSDGITQEVGVDAKTGKVLENAKEGPHPPERELDGRIVVQTSNRQGSGRPADLTAISLVKALLGRAGGEGWTPSMDTVRAAAR